MKLFNTILFASVPLTAAIGCLEAPATMGTTTGAVGSSGATTTGTAGASAGTTSTGTAGAGTASGAGSSATGTAGTTASMGGTGGTPPSMAGMSAGGMATAGMGAGGMATAGMGTGGTGGVEHTGDTLLPGMDGLFLAFRTMNPDDPGDGKYWLSDPDTECPTGDWATAGVTRTREFQAMGTPGQKYTINFEMRGALGLRCYTGGTPTAMTADAAGINASFYAGGEQFGDSPKNTLELAITPAVEGEAASTYFLNGIPSESGMCDEQITYDVGFKGSFVIMGDSLVTLSTHASDCQALQNCGADSAACDPRIVNVDGMEVRASPAQPISDYLNEMEFYPQWLVFDIQSIDTE